MVETKQFNFIKNIVRIEQKRAKLVAGQARRSDQRAKKPQFFVHQHWLDFRTLHSPQLHFEAIPHWRVMGYFS